MEGKPSHQYFKEDFIMKKSIIRILRKTGKSLLGCLIEAVCFAVAAMVQKTLLKGFKTFSNRRSTITPAEEPPETDDFMNDPVTEEPIDIDTEVTEEPIDIDTEVTTD
jgi:hypothetical protein